MQDEILGDSIGASNCTTSSNERAAHCAAAHKRVIAVAVLNCPQPMHALC
jgi:hypothetical protein